MSLAAAPRSTPTGTLETVIQRVKQGSRAWVKLGIPERLSLLEELSRGYMAIAEPSVRAACEAKGIEPHGPLAGEEWLAGPMVVVRNLRLLAESLRDIQRHGVP